ncbi:MAG: hypothetical protein QG650_249 [Patescibacteria group bacterium]|nr:hypothetical protein [Patescibacteria group bacterium]
MTDIERIESAARAFNRGDRRSFGAIFDLLSRDICRYVGYRVEDEIEREETVSDTFFRMLRHGKLPDDADAIRRFAYSVARSAVIDRYRGRKPTNDLDEADLSGKASHNENHAARIDNADTVARILGYLDTIGSEHKEILILRVWDDLPYEGIAAITGKSVDNCKKIVSRVLENVRSNVTYLFFFVLLFR